MTMGRAAAALVVIGLIVVVAGGCGSESESISDDEIIRQLELEESDGAYTIGDNAFCTVEELLNDSDEVVGLSKRERDVALTSRRGDVGILVETPFAPACEREAEAGLTKLSRQAQREQE
jgi:hypothetical protein